VTVRTVFSGLARGDTRGRKPLLWRLRSQP
jgi:hypothetical protein